MKTGSMDVLCDACRQPIAPLSRPALFVTLHGASVGRRKYDFCDWHCLGQWAQAQEAAAAPKAAALKP